jgi:RNA polymerase sigma-70 factor, ECF subfamily
MISATSTPTEQRLLAAACDGDEDAFRALVEIHRRGLHAHCYRMLGSLHDAEDALQEALLRAWRGLCGFDGRSSLRRWLYRITTNTCLDALARRPKRVLPIDYGPPASGADEPLADRLWLEPYPDELLDLEDGYAGPAARYDRREAVELAFVAALQHLPPRQRAVLILREVLGFSAKEVAESLETTVAAVNSALQRARKTVADRVPERSQQETLRTVGEERIREVVDSYVDAFARGDVDQVLALLAEDAVFSMPPWSQWWRGRETIAAFAKEAVEICATARTVPLRANGQPAIAYYALDDETGRWKPQAIDVLTFEGAQIREITGFILPALFPSFGLPSELTP